MKKSGLRVFTLIFVVLAFAIFTISCEPKVEKFSVKLEFNGAGFVSVSPKIPEDGKVEKGTELTFTASPYTDYVVDRWAITGDNLESGGEAGNITAVVVVNSDINVEVSFISGRIFSTGGVSFLMKKIDAVVGTTLGDNGQVDNKPHQVSLSEYWIGETEVTQELWEEVMENNPSFFDNTGIKNESGYDYDTALDSDEVQEKRAVEQVSWYDCIAFCNKLTKKVYGDDTVECVYYSDSSYNTVYESGTSVFMDISKKGFRLPTEAEWEYAAKGGEDSIYSGSNTIGEVAWWGFNEKNSSGANANEKTHQVKKLAENGYELYDMSGNVWEWCFDSWDGNSQPVSGDNPFGSSESFRVYRGGGWDDDLVDSVLVSRCLDEPSYIYFDLGLRLAGRF